MTWLLTGSLALLLGTAMLYGFTGMYPQFQNPAIKGVALFTLGIAAIWVPLSFVVAAFLVANGTRMIWLEACRLNQREVDDDRGIAVSRPAYTSIVNEDGSPVRLDHPGHTSGRGTGTGLARSLPGRTGGD